MTMQLVPVSPVREEDKVEQKVVNRHWQMASRSNRNSDPSSYKVVFLIIGRKACNALGHLLNLGQGIADAASRWFNLAVTYEFTKGRKQQYVIAACLYIACRKAKNDVMLIDFSDKLHVSNAPRPMNF